MKKYFLLRIVFLFVVSSAYAQQYRQIDKNLNILYKVNPSTKISFFFNQPVYAAGDTAYFLMRLVNSVDLKPMRKKGVWHLILVDRNGKRALDQFFIVEEGIASNQIIIPSSLQPGIYRLLCLPGNDFRKEYFYQRDFEIVGAYKNSVVDTVQSFSFFPEGGSIIEGAQNKIFVSVHPAGAWLLTLLDNLNKEVGSVKTNSIGIGSFFLKPKEGESFFLYGKVKNNTIKAPLPTAKKSGISFHSIIANGKLKVTGLASSTQGRPELILIKNDRVYYAEKIKLDDARLFSSEIALGETLSGLFQLWIVDKNTVLSSRTLYYSPQYESDILTMKHLPRVHPRSAMEILLQKSDSLVKGNFSIRLYQKSLFQTEERNIYSDLELADLTPELWSIQGNLVSDSINDLLATLPWRRYNIDSLARGKFKTGKANIDQPFSIRGSLADASRLTPQQSALVTMYFENSNFIEETTLDKDGKFILNLTQPIALEEKVYYKIEAGALDMVDATLNVDHPDKLLPSLQTTLIKEPNTYYSYKHLKDSIDRAYTYSADPTFFQKEKSRKKGLEAKSYGVDNVYLMKDYQTSLFSSMKDIVVEILSKAKLKTINGKNRIRLLLEDSNSKSPVLAKEDPLFIIDGTPTLNSDFFFGLKPSMIDKIKIIWKLERNALKSFGKNGVIIVETKEGNLPVPVPALGSFLLSGFSSPLPFNEPKLLSDRRIPNFKSCLYWNPFIKFNEKGIHKLSVFTPDDLGEFIVEVEGLTADGAPYFKRSSFVVTQEDDLHHK